MKRGTNRKADPEEQKEAASTDNVDFENTFTDDLQAATSDPAEDSIDREQPEANGKSKGKRYGGRRTRDNFGSYNGY